MPRLKNSLPAFPEGPAPGRSPGQVIRIPIPAKGFPPAEKEPLHAEKEILLTKKEISHAKKEFPRTEKEFPLAKKEFLHKEKEIPHPEKEFLHTRKEFPHAGKEFLHAKKFLYAKKGISST